MQKILLLVFLTALSSQNIQADSIEIDNTTYPQSRLIEGMELTLQGTDLLRYKGIWKLYTGALYLDESEALPFDQRARRLEVVYRREIKGPDLVDAGNKNLQNTFTAEELKGVKKELDTMNAWWMQTLNKDDRAAITYIPGKGTNLTINETSKGWIPGEEFARIYFSIWFGENAVDENFRDALMRK